MVQPRRPAGGQGQPARRRTFGWVGDGAPGLRRHARRSALPALDAIAASGHELVAVRDPARRARRAAAASWSARPVGGVGRRARHRGAHPGPARASRSSWTGCASWRPTACPVVAYGALVPPAALEIPAHGWINLHFSLLPAWRGAAPVQHAVLHGDEVTGASACSSWRRAWTPGRSSARWPRRSGPRDTSGDLLERLAVAGAGLLVAVLDAIEAGTARAVPQPADGVIAGAEDHRRGRPRCAGPSRRSRWTGGSGPARRRPARGRRSAASGSSSAR